MADNSRRLAGLVWLWIEGVEYEVVSQPQYGVSSVTRTTLASMRGISGYSETPKPGFIAATIRDDGTFNVRDFQDMTNVSVTLQLANGKRISGSGLWTVEAAEVDSTEATFSVRFEGDDVREG